MRLKLFMHLMELYCSLPLILLYLSFCLSCGFSISILALHNYLHLPFKLIPLLHCFINSLYLLHLCLLMCNEKAVSVTHVFPFSLHIHTIGMCSHSVSFLSILYLTISFFTQFHAPTFKRFKN